MTAKSVSIAEKLLLPCLVANLASVPDKRCRALSKSQSILDLGKRKVSFTELSVLVYFC